MNVYYNAVICYPPIDRMESSVPYITTRFIDDGFSGIISSHIKTIEQV